MSRNKKNKLVVAIITIVLLFGILLFPDHPNLFTVEHFKKLPLEWPLIVLTLLLLTGVALKFFRYIVLAALALALLLRTADIGSRLAFDRRFSPLVEWHLLGDGWNLASQQIGLIEAGVFVALVLIALALLVFALFKGLGAVGAIEGRPKIVIAALATLTLCAGTILFWQQDPKSKNPIVQASFVAELIDRSGDMRRSVEDQQKFMAQLNVDTVTSQTLAPTFSALRGLDVAWIFIESYGQSFLLDDFFRPAAEQRLSTIEAQITQAGLHVRSGWMTSPVRGGRSWLTHASFASGLPVTNQARYDRLIASNRVSLYELFSQAGWHSAGLVPAIRESWPEGIWYGFDRIYDFAGMNYAGEPFGWVTMPDQFTLAKFENDIRQPSEQDVMAEIALISSHAPWTPLPNLVPWDNVDDGSVFDGTQRFGEPMTWNNRTRVREMYAKSLDYSLETVGEYLELYGKGAFYVIHGDHQPASIIAGWGKTADVPVHIVSDNPDLLDRLPSDIFTSGMIPDLSSTSIPMWSMRQLMSSRFEKEPLPQTADGPDVISPAPASQ